MARKQGRQRRLEHERVRRRELERLKAEQREQSEKSRPGNEERPKDLTRGRRQLPSQQEAVRPLAARPRRVASGRRQIGQEVACAWCGRSVALKARGPIPKWCSPTCRHRAWEQDRAARSGRSAVTVVDRFVAATPGNTSGWLDHLAALTRQIRTRQLDVVALAAALELVQTAMAEQEPWHGGDQPW